MAIKEKDFWSGDWWDEKGDYSILHDFNIARLKFITNFLKKKSIDLSQSKCLDVGCGGGILIDALLNLNVKNVIGIDTSASAINAVKKKIFKKRSNCSLLLCATMSEVISYISSNTNAFDIVFCMDVLEHIDDYDLLIESVSKSLKQNGLFFISTINRGIFSIVFVKFFAEYVTKIVKKDTHSWSKFIKPEELTYSLEDNGFSVNDISGFAFNPLEKSFTLSSDLDLNYVICSEKIF